jgi:type I restriction enzyme S subunit
MNDSIPTNPTEISVASDWQILSIEGLCERVTSGATPYRSESRYYQGGAIQWFKTKELGSLRLVDSEEKITDAAIRETSVKLFPPGTVLMAMYGDGKTITSLGILEVEAATNQACCAMIPNTMVCDSRFLYYSLSHYKQDFLQIANGGAQRNLSGALIKNFCVGAPPLEEQKSIAHILGTLDDKIELNRKTNETLEAMAKALFKSWFVDFDPVRAKAEGRPTGLPAEISDLFPDSFEDSELGEIPSGWQCSPLADRAIYLSRGISPAYCEEGGVLVLNQKCVRDSRISFEKARRHDTTRKQIIGREVRRFDALVNSTGVGTLGRVAMMPICQEEVVVDSHVTVVRGSNEQESFFISSTLLNRQTEIEALGEGSTGQTELSRVVLGSVPVIFPSPQLISAYFDFAFIIQDKIEKNDQISVALASARDALLPKLISGEIRIPDAEKMLEEVGV